jgi:VWFA-related protein
MTQRPAPGSVCICLTVAFTMLAIGRPVAVATSAAQAHVYVSVADNKGKPVTGLTAADFQIAIDNRDQEILSVAPATEPISVVIITDRLGLDPAYSSFTVQHALSGFVKEIRSVPDSRLALTTFDGPVVRITGFNAPATDLNKAIARLSTNSLDGGMLDALVDACELLRETKTDRRVIFAMFAGYRGDTSTQWNDRAMMTMWQSNASLWAVEVQSIGGASGGNAGREEVVSLGSRMSGGMMEGVASAVGLANKAQQMAALITKQYVITYAPGSDASTSTRRKVAVNRNGVRILFPTWVAR